jgi:lipoprotein-anchoring transpeptidase ErfK/SrfK
VRLRDGKVVPTGKLASGERLEVHATVRRSSWAGWLVGRTEHVEATVTTPEAHVDGTLLHLEPGVRVVLRFDHPASRVDLKLPGYPADHLSFARPRKRFDTGVRATGKHRFGIAEVSVAARPWENLAPPVRVSWFPAGVHLQAVVKPAPGTTIEPVTPITITFSAPVSAVLGSARPRLDPATPGRWTETAPNALEFHPSQGFGLGEHVSIELPAPTDVLAAGRTQTLQRLSWDVPAGTTARLQQLLAELGYLPLVWHPQGGPAAPTRLAQTEAAIDPPSGHFTWRYPDTPSELQSMWEPDSWTRVTQGAVMAFEHDQGLTVDGIAGPMVWRTLIDAAIAGERAKSSYTYVLVHRTVPQNLTLWNDGQTILQARINTGVPAAPTPYGTHAVFEHIPVGTMRGVNPDGSHYVDPGIKWISYFYGGEAIHGFNRPTYGFPQSVGCVEAPNATAAKIWPYTPIGTLVTIAP